MSRCHNVAMSQCHNMSQFAPELRYHLMEHVSGPPLGRAGCSHISCLLPLHLCSLFHSLLLIFNPSLPSRNFLLVPLTARRREGVVLSSQHTPLTFSKVSCSFFSTSTPPSLPPPTNAPSSSLTPWWGEGGETLLTPHPSQLCLGNTFRNLKESHPSNFMSIKVHGAL